eukprot:1159366-Pelagomonas_calceolata.AAC.1
MRSMHMPSSNAKLSNTAKWQHMRTVLKNHPLFVKHKVAKGLQQRTAPMKGGRWYFMQKQQNMNLTRGRILMLKVG